MSVDLLVIFCESVMTLVLQASFFARKVNSVHLSHKQL